MIKKKLIPILNLITFIIMIVINVLAMINLVGSSTREIADSIPTLLMPIGLTFSVIWTVIYVLLGAYTIYQLFTKEEVNEDIGMYYMFTNLFNILWILSFHTKLFFISTVIIIGLNIILYLIVNKTTNANLLTRTTFSVYYAWITIAMFVSIFSFISSMDPAIYASIPLKIATVLAIIILMILALLRIDNYAYSITIVVGMIGLLLKQMIDFSGKYPEIIIVLMVSIIITMTILFINLISDKTTFKKLLDGGTY